MSNNDTNIEKRSFEAFVNAIGSEIEQAQVRLISAANAQMLFHYWKMGNYILYHQNRQGWGGKVIKKLAQAIRFNYPEKKGYSVRNLAYMCQFARSYPLTVLRSFIETDAKLITPSVRRITDEIQNLNNVPFTQEPLARIQSSDNRDIAIVQEPLAQIQDVAQTVAAVYRMPIEDMEKLFLASPVARINWASHVIMLDSSLPLGVEYSTLPSPQSDLANYLLKDPYIFDLAGAKELADERDIEEQLVKHVTRYLLEMGNNDNNIEKRSFEAFVNAIGSEIEQA